MNKKDNTTKYFSRYVYGVFCLKPLSSLIHRINTNIYISTTTSTSVAR